MEVKNNPDIVDDWELRPAKDVHFTKLVVGACWQGRFANLTRLLLPWDLVNQIFVSFCFFMILRTSILTHFCTLCGGEFFYF